MSETKREYVQDERSYVRWQSLLPVEHFEYDWKLRPFLSELIDSNDRRWLKRSRTALQLSGETIAKRAGTSRSAYSATERAEPEGAVTLEALRTYAQAMDCELVYAIRPKSRLTYSKHLWQCVQKEAVTRVERIPNLDAETRFRKMTLTAWSLWNQSKFRRAHGLSERT
jgi:transcriptional regulator with XRE-family HTH domain